MYFINHMHRRALWNIGLIFCFLVMGLAGCGSSHSPSSTASTISTPAPTMTSVGRTLIVHHGHNTNKLSTLWSPDGREIASFGGNSDSQAVNTLEVWNARTGQTLWKSSTSAYFTSVSWSPNSKRLAAIGVRTHLANIPIELDVWNAQTGKELWEQDYTGIDPAPTTLAWSPDGKRLAVGTGSQTSAAMQKTGVDLFDALTGTELPVHHSQNVVTTISWSSDAASITSTSDGGSVDVWSASDGKTIKTYNGGERTRAAWSPNRKILAIGGWTIQVLDVAANKTLCTYTNSNLTFDLTWSVDSQRIFSASMDTVQIRNALNCSILFSYTDQQKNSNAPGNILNAKWSPDNKYIAIVSQGHDVRVLNATTGATTITYTEHTQQVNSISWSPDSTLIASASQDGTVRIWQAAK